MEFQYTLSNDEINRIAVEMNKRLQNQLANDAAFKELSEKTLNVAKFFAGSLMSENALNADIRKIIAPLCKEEIKETLSNSGVISDAIKAYFQTDEFKRKQLWELEKRVQEIKKDLGEDYE